MHRCWARHSAGDRTGLISYMQSSLVSPIQDILTTLSAENRLRVWSVIITIFGDCIVPRGGQISLASLQSITDEMGIEANALRTSLSRLAKEGWIERERHGRQSSYRLAGAGQSSFARAESKIYSPLNSEWDGVFEIVLLHPEFASKRKLQAKSLKLSGFGEALQGVFVKPWDGGETSLPFEPLAQFKGESVNGMNLRDLATSAWPLDELNRSYDDFIRTFAPVRSQVEKGVELSEASALVLRIIMVHEWRRIYLKDVNLPEEMKPQLWRGTDAYRLVSSLYKMLVLQSEAYLNALKATPSMSLSKSDSSFGKRFT